MSAKKINLVQPDKIHIISTQILLSNISTPLDFSIATIQGHVYDLSFNLSFNLEDSLIKADFELSVATKSKEGVENESKGVFHFVYIFHIDNLKELTVSENEEITLNGGLGNALASIVYSTSRGILLATLKGTSLENFILPVIDPNSLLKTKTSI